LIIRASRKENFMQKYALGFASFVSFGLAALGQNQAAIRQAVAKLPVSMVVGAPYSAVEQSVESWTQADGAPASRDLAPRKLYRDSLGRTRTELTGGFPQRARVSIEIVDPVAGYRYSFTDRSSVAHRSPLGPVTRVLPSSEWVSKMGGQPLGTQSLSGLSASGTRISPAGPALSGATWEQWWSPDLGVIVLDKVVRSERQVVRQLSNITRSEPDASLFQVPSGYTVEDD
jgi:hypothetical protein